MSGIGENSGRKGIGTLQIDMWVASITAGGKSCWNRVP